MKTTKTKSPHNSQDLGVLTKSSHWSDYLSKETLRLYPGKDEWRKRLIHTMYSWLEEKDEKGRPVLEIRQFCMMYKIPWHTLKMYANQYEDVGRAYNDIKEFLASRRRVGVHHRDYGDSVFKDMHLYDPSWHKDVNQYWSDLKEKETAAGNKIIVEMPPAKVTGKVKPKKEKA